MKIRAKKPPLTVAYCHCMDCRRVTGAPVGAFAAFRPDDVSWDTEPGEGRSHHAGVVRWNCGDCGSPLAATYDYLPDQIYIPVGLFDNPDALPPDLHAHHNDRISWLHLSDTLPRHNASSRDSLNEAQGD